MEKPRVYLGKWDRKVVGLRRPTTIEIVCGDCSVRVDEAGNTELLPLRTLLAVDGRCYTCGGRSFVVASQLCGALHRTITERKRFRIVEDAPRENELTEKTARPFWDGAATSDVLVA